MAGGEDLRDLSKALEAWLLGAWPPKPAPRPRPCLMLERVVELDEGPRRPLFDGLHVATRACLDCGRGFRSKGPDNRICRRCRRRQGQRHPTTPWDDDL